VIRLIGQGGMGAVYEAEQEHPRRTVALKIIKPGMASPELLRRFEQETQALGRLQHPGIAQIYEAGTADTGFGPQPYFAMEYIRGRSLVKYADELKLDTRARLEIMARVCDAVQHAHQRGLIHRDLKPGNILVDESGQPKIVDFGVARLTDQDTQAATQSGAGQLIGTLAYMSPEQVLADPLEIDTRSDVYALGVILYELLAGRLPYDTSNKLHEALSAIREEDPARLSSVDHGYRGDIETIVAKALEKDKSRRYDSAAEMAADIRRYLTDDPITARPPSVAYQLQKFTRRHKALVMGVAGVFLVLVTGIAASIWQAARTGRERDRAVQAEDKARMERDRATTAEHTANAERDRAAAAETLAQRERDAAVAEKHRADTEAETAKALNDFLGADLLAASFQSGSYIFQPGSYIPVHPDPDITVRVALDNAVSRISGRFQTKPLVEAALRETIARAYGNLNAYAEAEKQLKRAIELRQPLQGKGHPETLRSMDGLGQALSMDGKAQEAADQLKKVLEELPYGTPEHTNVVREIAEAYRLGRLFPDAEAFLRGLLAKDRHRGNPDDTAVQTHVDLLVSLYRNWIPEPKYSEAETVLNEVLAQLRRTRGVDYNRVLRNANRLASVYAAQNKFRQVEELLTPLVNDTVVAKIAAGGRLALQQYPNESASMRILLEVYTKQGKSVQADALLNVSKLMDAADAMLLTSTARTARTYVQVGRDAEADKLIPKVLEGLRLVVVQKDSSAMAVMSEVSSIIHLNIDQGKHARAQRLLREVLDIHLTMLSEEDAATTLVKIGDLVDTFGVWGTRDSFEKTEQLLEGVVRIQRRVLGESGPFRGALGSLSQVYWDHAKFELAHERPREAQRDYEKAEGLIAELVKVYSSWAGGANQRVHMSRLAQVRASLGKYDEAESLITEVLAYRRLDPNEIQNNPIALSSLGWVRILQRKYSEAEVVLREACRRFERSSEQRHNCDSVLGASLVGQKKFVEAEPLLLAGYEGLIHAPVDERSPASAAYRLTTSRFHAQDAGEWIVRLYEEWGKPEQAVEWKRKLDAAKSRVN
jgi:non-specific serine/threonine protein kinase/serine/threonine-protein kinase